MHDNIELWFALPIAFALILTLLVMIFRHRIVADIDNFFAHRRHLRRQRNKYHGRRAARTQ